MSEKKINAKLSGLSILASAFTASLLLGAGTVHADANKDAKVNAAPVTTAANQATAKDQTAIAAADAANQATAKDQTATAATDAANQATAKDQTATVATAAANQAAAKDQTATAAKDQATSGAQTSTSANQAGTNTSTGTANTGTTKPDTPGANSGNAPETPDSGNTSTGGKTDVPTQPENPDQDRATNGGPITSLPKKYQSEDITGENISNNAKLNAFLATDTAKAGKLNDTAKKIIAAALREGSTVTMDQLTDKVIDTLNKVDLFNKTMDNQYTLKDYDSITNKVVTRDKNTQIPLVKGDKVVNMPGLEKVKDAETGEEATMDIWDSWPVQDPKTGYVQNWNGYQLVVAMMGIPHKSDSHLYLLYNKYGDNNFANWKVAGSIFGYNMAVTSGQWSGSAMLNSDGSIQLYYANVLSQLGTNHQRVASATVNLGLENGAVSIKGVENDQILFEGDGITYQTFDQWANGANRGGDNPQNRDGHIFQDDDGNYYLAFETATGNDGSNPERYENLYQWGRYGGDASYNLSEIIKVIGSDDMTMRAQLANSSIGFMKLDMSNPKKPKVEKLYSPLVQTVLAGDEIERPDLMKLNGKYYLFVDARINHATDTDLSKATDTTVGDNVTMLGFVSDSLTGNFVPLNGDGLVLGASVPFSWRSATYSYYAVKINPDNIKGNSVTVNGKTYTKDYFVNHFLLVNPYMGNRGEVAGAGKNATLGPSYLVEVKDDGTTQVVSDYLTQQGVWDWNENSSDPELVATTLKEARAKTDVFVDRVNKNGSWYLYRDNADGKISQQTGWQRVGNNVQYYSTSTGAQVFGAQTISNKKYYFDDNSGALYYGQHKINDQWYNFDKTTGEMLTGFVNISSQNKTVYYDPTDGHMLYGQQKIDGKWYNFADLSGKMLTGFVYIASDKKTVYYNAQGQMVYGRQKINGKWYDFDKKTGAMKTGFVKLSKKVTVYYDKNGQMLTGQHKINGKWYNFDKKTGAMLTGFVKIVSQKKTVYYNAKGQMLYGAQKIKGKWYLFDKKSGAKITYAKVGKYVQVKRNSGIYNAKGKKSKAYYKSGKKVYAQGYAIIKNKLYYKIAKNKYVAAGNIDGVKRTVKKAGYVYAYKNKKLKKQKGLVKKGAKKYTYGGAVLLKGKKYYVVAPSKYMSTKNF
ncbi:MAG: glycoside hydrolase family 68 protein [Lacticaseibacillus absianus]